MAQGVGSVSLAERLTPGREKELVIAAEGGDAEARGKLVEAFLPAITGLARRFPSGIGVNRQELLQEGVAGLLFAAQRYDSRLDTPFWAYASFWVRKGMQELVAELTRPVALSDRAVRDLAGIKAARSEHLRENGTEPTNGELSTTTGFTLAHLESLQVTERRPRGTEEPVSAEEEDMTTVGDRITDPVAEQAYDRVLDEIEISEVGDLADRLDGRERAVIGAHYGLGQPPQTLDQIGDRLGLTAERARQIEVGGLDKLRDLLSQRAPTGERPA
jgi:RNA polymerase primary sigma factor